MTQKELFSLKQLCVDKDANLIHNKCITNFLDSDYNL